jgi:hypothetical protein
MDEKGRSSNRYMVNGLRIVCTNLVDNMILLKEPLFSAEQFSFELFAEMRICIVIPLREKCWSRSL